MATCVGAVEDSVASVPKQLLASPDMADTLRPLRQLASDLAASLEANSHGALASRVRALPL